MIAVIRAPNRQRCYPFSSLLSQQAIDSISASSRARAKNGSACELVRETANTLHEVVMLGVYHQL